MICKYQFDLKIHLLICNNLSFVNIHSWQTLGQLVSDSNFSPRALPTSSPSKKNEKKKVEISSESETSSSDDSEDELLLPRRCRREV